MPLFSPNQTGKTQGRLSHTVLGASVCPPGAPPCPSEPSLTDMTQAKGPVPKLAEPGLPSLTAGPKASPTGRAQAAALLPAALTAQAPRPQASVCGASKSPTHIQAGDPPDPPSPERLFGEHLRRSNWKFRRAMVRGLAILGWLRGLQGLMTGEGCSRRLGQG